LNIFSTEKIKNQFSIIKQKYKLNIFKIYFNLQAGINENEAFLEHLKQKQNKRYLTSE